MDKDLYNQTILNFEKDYFLNISPGSFYDKFDEDDFNNKRNFFTSYLNKRYKSLIVPPDFLFNKITNHSINNLVNNIPMLYWTTVEGIEFFDLIVDSLIKENNSSFVKNLLKKDIGAFSNISFWSTEIPYSTLKQLPVPNSSKQKMLTKVFKNILYLEKEIEETEFSTNDFNEIKKRIVNFKKELPILFNEFKKISKNNDEELKIIEEVEYSFNSKNKKLTPFK
jgi:hypothetical protein